ncbi:MAG TPA: hypothetical protein HPP83_02825 [Candidatus Hydrogenedentes bacterium]|nr:hypothetical protein [Candidatus Hydrogenedentota bacterium]
MWSYVIGILGVLLVVLLWVAVQRLARKVDNLPPDCDMLEVGERCHGCVHKDACAVYQREEQNG